MGLPGNGGFSGLSPGPPGSLGAQLPGSWLGLMFPKGPPELGSCLAMGHGQCDWAAGLVTRVRGDQRTWACGLGLWEAKKFLESSFCPSPLLGVLAGDLLGFEPGLAV